MIRYTFIPVSLCVFFLLFGCGAHSKSNKDLCKIHMKEVIEGKYKGTSTSNHGNWGYFEYTSQCGNAIRDNIYDTAFLTEVSNYFESLGDMDYACYYAGLACGQNDCDKFIQLIENCKNIDYLKVGSKYKYPFH